MKKSYLSFLVFLCFCSFDVMAKSNEIKNIVRVNSTLVSGHKMADETNGVNGIYVYVQYDTSTSSVVIAAARGVNGVWYDVLSHNGSSVTIGESGGYLWGNNFKVTIDYPGGPRILTVNGGFNYVPSN